MNALPECILYVLGLGHLEISIIEKLLENVPGVTTNGDCRDKTEILVLISGSNSWNKKKK